MMTAHDVLAVLAILGAAGAPAWIDGGWGVDALVGTQTRDHQDLDLVLAREHVGTACEALARHGLTVVTDEQPTRLVLGNDSWAIDVHPVRFDAAGAGWQAQPDGSEFRYPPAGFQGVGRIGGCQVACLSAGAQDLCHRGYAPDAKDEHDMRLLHAHFPLPTPWP